MRLLAPVIGAAAMQVLSYSFFQILADDKIKLAQ
jgi:hypothetical protein